MSTESSYDISEVYKNYEYLYEKMTGSLFNSEDKRIAMTAMTQFIGIQNMKLLADMDACPEIWEKYKKLVDVLPRVDPTAFQGSQSPQSILIEKINKVQKILSTCQKYHISYSTYEAFMDGCMKQENQTPILHAVIEGNIDMIKVLCELENDVNEMSQSGETPLTQAISLGNIEMAKLLIALGANVNQATKEGMTPMSMAVINKNTGVRQEMVTYLHVRGVELDRPDKHGWTPMIQAAMTGYVDVMRLLYKLNSQDVDVGKAFPINFVGPIKISGIMQSLPDVLLERQQFGAAALLKQWDAKQKYGIKALHKNLYNNIQMLSKPENSSIEQQEEINDAINNEMLKLIRMSDADLVQEFVNNMEIWEQYKQLIAELPQGGPEELQSILRKKVLEKVEKIQQIIGKIFTICPCRIQRVIETCAEHDIAFSDYFMFMYECMGKTKPIMQAVATKNTNMIKALHALGFDMNALDEEGGYTPMIWAVVFQKDVEMIRLLRDLGANINQAGEEGCTPMLYAVAQGDVEIVRVLCELGADVNRAGSKEYEGFTPMCKAAMRGDTDMMQLLYDLGTRDPRNPINLDCLIKYKPGKKILFLSYLILSDKSAAEELLKKWGADQKSALDIVARLRLAHVWGLAGNSTVTLSDNKITFSLTGIYREYGIKMLYEHIDNFFNSNISKLSKDEKRIIRESIANAFPLLDDNDQILSRINQGKPVVFSSGSDRHAVSVVIQGNQLAICNRGEGKTENSIKFYCLPKSYTDYTDSEMIEIINKLKTSHSNMDEFNNMIASLKLIPNQSVDIQQKDQEVGNCVWASNKGIFGILCMFLRNNDISVMDTIYKEFTAYARVRELVEYLKNAHEGTLDVTILKQILEKILEKHKKTPGLIPEELVEELKLKIEELTRLSGLLTSHRAS